MLFYSRMTLSGYCCAAVQVEVDAPAAVVDEKALVFTSLVLCHAVLCAQLVSYTLHVADWRPEK